MSNSLARTGWETVGAAIASREEGQLFPMTAAKRPLLTIGLCSSLSCGLLRELVRRIAEEANAPELAFREASPGRIRLAARRREVDVAIVQGAAGLEGLERQALWREPALAAMAERHPLTRDSDVAAQDLLRQKFLAHGGAAEHALQAALLSDVLGEPPLELDCLPVDRETLLELASLGQGVTVIPGSAAAVFHPGVSYRLIKGAEAFFSFHAVWRAGGSNPAIGPFIAQARALALRGAAPG
jgi:DNA-binding transcriptional LysR family regulator